MSEIEQNSWVFSGLNSKDLAFEITRKNIHDTYPLIGLIYKPVGLGPKYEWVPAAWDLNGVCLLAGKTSENILNIYDLQPPWPQSGDIYWYVSSSGQPALGCFTGKKLDKNRRDLGNFFKYEEGAQMAAEEVNNIFRGFKNGEL